MTSQMLAYVFWHRPHTGVALSDYEARLEAFHRELDIGSASFRIKSLPFDLGGGYEDWYLVKNWTELGTLNQRVTSGRRRGPHDAVAGIAAEGWGAVYALVRGERRPPSSAHWVSKPPGQSYDRFLQQLVEPGVWQRQMVLGPAPEFCVVRAEEATSRDAARVAVYPATVS